MYRAARQEGGSSCIFDFATFPVYRGSIQARTPSQDKGRAFEKECEIGRTSSVEITGDSERKSEAKESPVP